MYKIIFNSIVVTSLLTSLSEARTYDKGNVTIKPIGLNFYSYTFGRKHNASKINHFKINTFRGYPGLAGNRADRAGTGYDVELGYMFNPCVEGFLMAGFTLDRPLKNTVFKDPLTDTAKFIFVDDVLKFKRRNTYNVSIGSRYYIDMKSSWVPFFGLRFGAIFQRKTKANVYDRNPFNHLFGFPDDTFLAHKTILKSKTFIDGSLQVGIDYKFTDMWCLTMMSGVQYHPHAGRKLTRVKDQNNQIRRISYRDNWNKWTIPFIVSLKIVL